jgi:hypothetical protein
VRCTVAIKLVIYLLVISTINAMFTLADVVFPILVEARFPDSHRGSFSRVSSRLVFPRLNKAHFPECCRGSFSGVSFSRVSSRLVFPSLVEARFPESRQSSFSRVSSRLVFTSPDPTRLISSNTCNVHTSNNQILLLVVELYCG